MTIKKINDKEIKYAWDDEEKIKQQCKNNKNGN